MRADPKAIVRQPLAAADQAFADTGDVMVALEGIGLAAQEGVPIPPHMARWLRKALQDYCNGHPVMTMDAAMGLDKPGKAQPRLRRQNTMKKNDMLGRMWFLMAAGATRKQAAALVAKLTGREADQLARSYGESWFARRTDDPFGGGTAADNRGFIEDMLAEYPDGAETAQEKAAIRQRHPD